MIVILVDYSNRATFNNFFKDWGKEVRPLVKLLFYSDVISRKNLPRGIYIFSDIELLHPLNLARACEIARQLCAAGIPILNDPRRAMKRYDLLEILHRKGLNQSRCYRIPEIKEGKDVPRFPVFLRRENDHSGSISSVLRSSEELDVCLQDVLDAGVKQEELIVTEYCDVADEKGVFGKYSAYMVGEQFLTRSLLFSSNWVTKSSDVLDDEKMRAEIEYSTATPHPHEEMIRRIFALGHIDYGRIDYGIKDGTIQTWEINTNPYIQPAPSPRPERLELQHIFVANFCNAFKNLNQAAPVGPDIPLSIAPELRKQLKVRFLDRYFPPRQGIRRYAHHLGNRVRRLLRML